MPRRIERDGPEKMADSPEFARIVEDWDPLERAVSCSNCAHVIVTGDGVHIPLVQCEMGQGRPRSFWQIVRAYNPSSFMVAAECPYFSSMSD